MGRGGEHDRRHRSEPVQGLVDEADRVDEHRLARFGAHRVGGALRSADARVRGAPVEDARDDLLEVIRNNRRLRHAVHASALDVIAFTT